MIFGFALMARSELDLGRLLRRRSGAYLIYEGNPSRYLTSAVTDSFTD